MKEKLIILKNTIVYQYLHPWYYNAIYVYKATKYKINKLLGKPVRYYCDYCNCPCCKYGWEEAVTIRHAPTLGGKYICDVCYEYDLCTSGPNRNPDGPCKDYNCEHRPRLIGEFE